MLGYQDVHDIGFKTSIEFFQSVGYTEIYSLDVENSDYENRIVHNLNDPIPNALRSRFDLVVDGGTVEHVFDIKVALSSVHTMLRPLGTIIHLAVMNNFINHGFYQFSPTLFFSVYRTNGYKNFSFDVTKNRKIINANGKRVETSHIYSSEPFQDEVSIGMACRIIFSNTDINDQLPLMFSAQKAESNTAFKSPIQAFYDPELSSVQHLRGIKRI